jgi:hypothetical protein
MSTAATTNHHVRTLAHHSHLLGLCPGLDVFAQQHQQALQLHDLTIQCL